jgi:dipeptidyl aminopeptidase/acylaminoacyl peptidase
VGRAFAAWREKVQGDKSFDLDSVSPLYSAARIDIPLLIAHGDEDDNVPLSQSKKLHDAMSKANKPHTYVVYEGEGHGLENPGNAVDFLKRVDDFLKTHNPAELN